MKTTENKFDAFHAAGMAEWERAAIEELKGADPWEKLSREDQGIVVKPYYHAETPKRPSLQLPAATQSFHGPRTWYNSPLVIVNKAAEANAAALEHLRQGADGIFFALDDAVDFGALLKSIEWPICALHFIVKKNTDGIARALSQYLDKIKGPAIGALFGNPAGSLPAHGSFRFAGQVIETSSPEAMANAINRAQRQLGNRFPAQARDVAFSLEVGTDFFSDASKLRALRAVWNRLLEESGVLATPIYIHAWSKPWTSAAFAPHGNMLKATTAAMASILGGCDALTIEPESEQDPMMSRIARNVAIVLREESHFSKVADPLAGTYFVDDLTRQLTDQIWSHLKKGATS